MVVVYVVVLLELLKCGDYFLQIGYFLIVIGLQFQNVAEVDVLSFSNSEIGL